MLYLPLLLLLLSTSNAKDAPPWHCGELELRWQENPAQAGTEFRVKGCRQEKSLALRSDSCKDEKSCIRLGKGKEFTHPGGAIGSPGFVSCYRAGGKPRFLAVKVDGRWENSSACFFGGQERFLDFETMIRHALKNP